MGSGVKGIVTIGCHYERNMWDTPRMWNVTYHAGVVFLAFQTLSSGAVSFDMRLFCLLLNNLGVSRHTLGKGVLEPSLEG